MAKNPGLEWWVELAVDCLGQNPLSFAKTLSKLPKLIVDSESDEEVGETDAAVLAHTNGVLEKVYQPLPIEPDLRLWDIYITPAANYLAAGEGAEEKKVPDLLGALRQTVGTSTAPIVVHGQPGHGKTSSMRMLTQVLALDARDRTDTLLFYEFKNLGDLNATLWQTLQRVTPFVRTEAFFHGRRTLLVLDGMDERQISEGTDIHLGNFIRDIFRLAKGINGREDGASLNVIFTGRTLFVDQVKRYFTEAYHRFEIIDFTNEQIDAWLRKYHRLKQLAAPLTRDVLVSKHLDQLMSQPILLTMVARIITDPRGAELLDDIPEDEVTRGRIYRTIVSWTYQKKHHDDKGVSTLPDEATYTRFLQMVAYLMFRNGRDSIPLKELVAGLAKNETDYQLASLWAGNRDMKTVIKDLAVGFYFEGRNEDAFAFIHKSIGEYLTVEAMFTLLTEALAGFNPAKPEKSCRSAAEDLYFILGKATLSFEDHLPFLRDLLKHRGSDAFQQKLVAFFNGAADHGLLIKNEGGQNDNPLVTEANLLGALSYWIFAHKTKPGNIPALAGTIKLIKAIHPGFRFLLRGADLSKDNLVGVDLSGSDLRGADLSGVDLRCAILINVDLSNAVLTEAKLFQANLDGAKLMGANLDFAYLNLAYLGRARLDRANLKNSILIFSFLCNAHVTGADLSGANLFGAVLAEEGYPHDRRSNYRYIRDWRSIRFKQPFNIKGINLPPEGFRGWALENGAVELDLSEWETFKEGGYKQKEPNTPSD